MTQIFHIIFTNKLLFSYFDDGRYILNSLIKCLIVIFWIIFNYCCKNSAELISSLQSNNNKFALIFILLFHFFENQTQFKFYYLK